MCFTSLHSQSGNAIFFPPISLLMHSCCLSLVSNPLIGADKFLLFVIGGWLASISSMSRSPLINHHHYSFSLISHHQPSKSAMMIINHQPTINRPSTRTQPTIFPNIWPSTSSPSAITTITTMPPAPGPSQARQGVFCGAEGGMSTLSAGLAGLRQASSRMVVGPDPGDESCWLMSDNG